jgi:hypothetical protein
MEFLDWLEHSAFPMWIKESESLWPYDIFCLSAHAIGMALLVGFSSAIALRVLGFAPSLALGPMAKFMPVVYAGFWLNALSGTGLFITYPVKAVTNPVFYLKLAGVVAAIVCIRRIKHELFDTPGAARDLAALERAKRPAATLLVVWVVTITAGRLLAYKGIPAIEWMATLFMAIVSAIAVGIGYLSARLRGPQASARLAHQETR